MDQTEFLHIYWEYYLEIEQQFYNTKRYVDFNNNNFKTYSLEYLQLLQTTCSEIDVIAKVIAKLNGYDLSSNVNIQKWGYALSNEYPNISNTSIVFNKTYCIIPWEKFGYVYVSNREGKMIHKLSDGAQNPEWWKSYNKAKHERTKVLQNGKANYTRANLENVINAMGALLIIEGILFELLEGDNVCPIDNSCLFSCVTIPTKHL